MSDQRTGQGEPRRAFRPTLDGTLEPRLLMATSAIRAQTASGGEAVVVTNTDGSRFFVSVAFGGTVQATPASGGRVNLIVNGTNSSSLLEINQILPAQTKGTAHTYQPALGANMTRLNVASVKVNSGTIGAIEGYQTANLSGPLTVTGSNRVDRIAFYSILAGGSIAVSGDLNTLDIYRDVDLNSTTGIDVGRDLSWFEAYGNVDITNGSNITVGRDLGANLQPAKGSGNAGQGVNISGNLTIDAGSEINVTRFIPPPAGVVVTGDFTGFSNFVVAGDPLIPVGMIGNTTVLGALNPFGTQPADTAVQGTVTA